LGEVCGMQSAPSLADCNDISNTYNGQQWKNFQQACQTFYNGKMQDWIKANTTSDYVPTEQDYIQKQWKQDGGKTGSLTIVTQASEDILNAILNQGGEQFAAWIRGKNCDGTSCDPEEEQQRTNVKNTIDQNISSVFKNN